MLSLESTVRAVESEVRNRSTGEEECPGYDDARCARSTVYRGVGYAEEDAGTMAKDWNNVSGGDVDSATTIIYGAA